MARASPRARVAVVLAVGAILKGQASSGTVMLRTISLWQSKGAVGFCGEGDDGNVSAFNGGDEGGYFFRGAGITHGDEQV